MTYDKLSSSRKQELDNSGFQQTQRMQIRPLVVLIGLAGSCILLFVAVFLRLG